MDDFQGCLLAFFLFLCSNFCLIFVESNTFHALFKVLRGPTRFQLVAEWAAWLGLDNKRHIVTSQRAVAPEVCFWNKKIKK